MKLKIYLNGYVNVFRMKSGRLGVGEVWPTKSSAQFWRNDNAIACIPINLEFEEGEGL